MHEVALVKTIGTSGMGRPVSSAEEFRHASNRRAEARSAFNLRKGLGFKLFETIQAFRLEHRVRDVVHDMGEISNGAGLVDNSGLLLSDVAISYELHAFPQACFAA
jgi:hypothetical protein